MEEVNASGWLVELNSLGKVASPGLNGTVVQGLSEWDGIFSRGPKRPIAIDVF